MKNGISEKTVRLLLADSALEELTAVVQAVMDDELARGEQMDAALVAECVDFLIAAEEDRNDAFTLLIPLMSSESFLNGIRRNGGRRTGRAARVLLYAAIILSLLFASNAVLAEFSGYNFLENVAEAIQQSIDAEAEEKTDDSPALPPADDTALAGEEAPTDTEASEEAVITATVQPKKKTAPAGNKVDETVAPPVEETPAEPYIVRVVGNGPDKTVYSTEDTVLSTYGLALRFVYSDGSISPTYYHTDARIVTPPDFTKAGTQRVTLRIGEFYDYTYSITVNEAAHDTPENKRLLRLEVNKEYVNGYLFCLGDTIEDTHIAFYACYSDGSKEYIDYLQHRDEVTLEGLDLSEETVFSKTLTVTYRGVSGSAEYKVRKKRTVYKAAFSWREHPKTLYYKGEPLGYGVGVDTETVLPSLASFKALPKAVITKYGTTYNTELYWSIDAEFQYDYMETQLLPEELDFVGYNPQQEGYQRIDIYYRGTYLLSYYVFVYGDSGLIPAVMPNDNMMAGDTQTDYSCRYYYTATGGGSVEGGTQFVGSSADTVADADNLQPGEREVTTVFPDGTSYCYKKYARLPLNKMKSNMDFSESLLKVPLANVRELPEELRDYRWLFTLEDGSEVTVDPAPYYVGVTEFHGTPLTPHDDISSMFGYAEYDADRRFFEGGHRVGILCYTYNVGFENAYSLTVECDSSYYFGQCDLIRADKTESFYKTFMLTFRVSAVDNEWGISQYRDNLTISGVDYGVLGDYTATFTLRFYGETLTAQRPVKVVEQIYTPTLRLVSDPNSSKRFVPGDIFDADRATFAMTDESGSETPVSADAVAYHITKNGSGCRLGDDMADGYFTVSYSYLRDNGKYVTCTQSYRIDFAVNNAHFYYDRARHIVYGSWDAVDGADFYEFTVGSETYTTDTNAIIMDRNVDEILKLKQIKMRCGAVRDGITVRGTVMYFTTPNFTARPYEEPTEPTTEPATEPTTEPATEPTTEPTTQPEALTPAEAKALLSEWSSDLFGKADGDTARFDVTHDGVVNAKDYAVLLRQAAKAE